MRNHLFPKKKREMQRLRSVNEFIRAKFKEDIFLSEIAAMVDIAPESFSRYFKSVTNKTFTSYLLEMRIRHACKLLMKSNLKVAEIAKSSGFNNLSNFNRSFKSNTGKTPSKYYKDYWGKQVIRYKEGNLCKSTNVYLDAF